MDPASVLRAYALLSDDVEPPAPQRNVLSVRPEYGLYPIGAHRVFEGKRHDAHLMLTTVDRYSSTERLLKQAQLERDTRSQLRLGWLWFSGTTEVDGEPVNWCLPALSAPVRRVRPIFRANPMLEQVGDAEITELISDDRTRESLRERAQFGGGALLEGANPDVDGSIRYLRPDERMLPRLDRLNSWARDVARGLGLSFDQLELADDDTPWTVHQQTGIRAFACFGLYFDSGAAYSSSRVALEGLARLRGLKSTALAPLLGADVSSEERTYVHQVAPFSSHQQLALERIKTSNLSALSGPPGTGKTHLLAVAAVDAVAWGKSVLVVASSKHATDVLVDYLAQIPGPTPVVFDGSARGRDLAFNLIDHAGTARADRSESESVIRQASVLDAEFAALFASLREATAAGKDVADDAAPTIGALADRIHSHDSLLADAFGEVFTGLWVDALSSKQRALLRELGYSLSSTRNERKESLVKADPEELTTVAPLWVGTLEDVEGLLPAAAGMFDLVIFDEAAQTSPMDAAGALVRAKRAIVCGDPVQLGHSSFLSQDQIWAAAEDFNLDPVALDPRSQSLFDMAASRVPVTTIDEHYRSAPHLIEFSARRFYDKSLHVMTRHPKNQDADHIDIRVVEGARNSSKVNQVEVDACMEAVESHLAQGWKSIGVITPFRAQADALEEAMLNRFTLSQVDGGLRVGTVHAFQGDECDVIVASWAIGPNEGDKAWSFVNQAKLFNVMVTRAREQMVVVTSEPKPPGLAGEYVRWSEPLVDLVGEQKLNGPWPEEVASALEYADVQVRRGYQVGHHVVDVVAGPAEHAVAIDCGPHPDGAEAHLDRALHLRRMGWNTADAFEVEWRNNTAGLVVDLLRRFPDLRTIAP